MCDIRIFTSFCAIYLIYYLAINFVWLNCTLHFVWRINKLNSIENINDNNANNNAYFTSRWIVYCVMLTNYSLRHWSIAVRMSHSKWMSDERYLVQNCVITVNLLRSCQNYSNNGKLITFNGGIWADLISTGFSQLHPMNIDCILRVSVHSDVHGGFLNCES